MKFDTIRADWPFIVFEVAVGASALSAIALDFIFLQGAAYDADAVSLIGLAMMVTGFFLRTWARKTLGKMFAYGLRVRPDHVISTGGPYRFIRHPMYTGSLLFWLGLAVVFHSPYGLLLMLLLVPCFIYRISIEEKMLIGRFGDQYRSYARHTKRLVPLVY